jgi:hypothetical protein
MPKKNGRPNKVKLSRYRKGIDELIIEGVSDRNISAWLKEQDPPEKIGKSAINDYRRNHFNINEDATQAYNDKKSQERKDGAVKQKVAEIEALDDIIKIGNDLDLDLGSLSPDVDEGTSQLDIEKAKIQAKNLVIRAAKVKHDITKDETPAPINLHINLNDKQKRLKRIGAKHDYRRSSGSTTRDNTDSGDEASDKEGSTG